MENFQNQWPDVPWLDIPPPNIRAGQQAWAILNLRPPVDPFDFVGRHIVRVEGRELGRDGRLKYRVHLQVQGEAPLRLLLDHTHVQELNPGRPNLDFGGSRGCARYYCKRK